MTATDLGRVEATCSGMEGAAARQSRQDQSCRSVLDELDRRGELLVVEEEVDPVHDLSAMLSLVDARAAVVFDRIKGHAMPAFGNILSGLDRIGLALGVSKEQIQDRLLAAIAAPIAPVMVQNAPSAGGD